MHGHVGDKSMPGREHFFGYILEIIRLRDIATFAAVFLNLAATFDRIPIIDIYVILLVFEVGHTNSVRLT